MSEISHRYGSHPDKPHSSRADRPSSFKLEELPIPSGREEDWRFTPLERISMLFPDRLNGRSVRVRCGEQELDTAANHRVVLGEKSTVTLRAISEPPEPTVGVPGDRTAVVAWNNPRDLLEVGIAPGEVLAEPVLLQITCQDSEPTAQHVVIRAGENSSAVVLLVHSGSGKLNQTVEVDVADGAQLTVVSTQEWEDDATHASNHRTRVGKDATLKHIVVSLGGDLIRICPDFEFTSTGGDIEALGAYFVDADQHIEHRPFVNHNQPYCKSRVTYKGALQGESAHTVWIGDCLIGEAADGTDTYELNRNLVLTPGAKADSVPNLEIENGEIEGAGHASATGRFDDEQLFYLCSRGISEDAARRLVVRGFFAELINQIDVEPVQERLMQAIEEELDRAARDSQAAAVIGK